MALESGRGYGLTFSDSSVSHIGDCDALVGSWLKKHMVCITNPHMYTVGGRWIGKPGETSLGLIKSYNNAVD